MAALPGEIAHEFNERMRRQVLELHDTTARAYGAPTLAEYAHNAALEKATRKEMAALAKEEEQRSKEEKP